jgi:IPT/TIG domain-containing protein
MDVNTLSCAWCRIVRHRGIPGEVVPARTRHGAILAALLSLAAILPLPEAQAGNIVYAYDALGRLIQASDVTGGQAVVYQYDSVGNISSQQIIPLGTLAISGFSSSQGSAGTQLTINGAGFSTITSANTVTFNGVPATVISATQTQLVVLIPNGATTGTVSVQTGSVTAKSPDPFVVSPTVPPPTIAAFSPALASVGTNLTLTGGGFDPVIANNKVQMGSGPWVSADAVTATTIMTRVPVKAWSGKLRLMNPRGTAVSATDFFVPPSGYTAATIGSTGRITVGTSATISLPTAGQSSLQIFDASAGDLLSVGVTALTISSATVKVFSPDGSQLTSATVSSINQGLQLPQLPLSGTYAIAVDPGSNTGNMTLSLASPTTGTVAVDGSPLSLNLSPSGQRAFVTFAGTAGQYLTVVAAGGSFTGTVSVSDSTGAQIVSASLTPSNSSRGVQLPKLTATGTYTIFINPSNTTSSLQLSVISAVAGSVSSDGTPMLLLTNPAARGLITFTGSPGQFVTLTVQEGTPETWGSNNISSFAVTVFAPDGSILNLTPTMQPPVGAPTYTFACNIPGSIAGCFGDTIINLKSLPTYAAGTTFTALVTQTGGSGGSLTYQLSTPFATDPLVVNGASNTIFARLPGQGWAVPITLVGGQRYNLTVSETNGNVPSVYGMLYGPRGQVIVGPQMNAVCSSPCSLNNYSGTASWILAPLSSDTYTLILNQIPQLTGANEYGPLIGFITFQITSPAP